MKKIVFGIMSLVLVFSLAACSGNATSSTTSSTETSSLQSASTASESSSTIVFENEGIKISYVSIDRTSLEGVRIHFDIENTSDTPVFIKTDSITVDGVEISGFMVANVGAGKTSDGSMSIVGEDLKANGLNADSISKVNVVFSIVNEKTTQTITTDSIEIVL